MKQKIIERIDKLNKELSKLKFDSFEASSIIVKLGKLESILRVLENTK